MAKYYCKGCDDIIDRDSNEKTMVSMCSTANDKKITLIRVTESVYKSFKQLKKLSKT